LRKMPAVGFEVCGPDAEAYEILDDRFLLCIKRSARVERLYAGCRWAEGPVYVPAGRYLLWSDIPADRMLRWDEVNGVVGTFRGPAGYSNGLTLDAEARLVSCEHAGRRVTRTEHDGTLTVLADRFKGKRFNSPNDVVVRSDHSVWFTDPPYGIESDYEGHRAESELASCNVYRVDPVTRECRIVAGDFVRPNGLGFSPDERRLYISDTGASRELDGPRHIRVFDVANDGLLSGGSIFATCTKGVHDGFCLDEAGRVWASASDGVHCYDPDGSLIGKVLIPEVVANLAFGGPKRNRLFICATTSLYSVFLPVNGAPLPLDSVRRSP
jgi:gluconolactonase